MYIGTSKNFFIIFLQTFEILEPSRSRLKAIFRKLCFWEMKASMFASNFWGHTNFRFFLRYSFVLRKTIVVKNSKLRFLDSSKSHLMSISNFHNEKVTFVGFSRILSINRQSNKNMIFLSAKLLSRKFLANFIHLRQSGGF